MKTFFEIQCFTGYYNYNLIIILNLKLKQTFILLHTKYDPKFLAKSKYKYIFHYC